MYQAIIFADHREKHITIIYDRSKFGRVLRLDMVDTSTSLSKPISGWMFVIGQTG